jgi:hypothetical protein
MGMVEKELEEFELPVGQDSLVPLVAQDATIRIKPQAPELPNPLIPQIEPLVVPGHLRLDEAYVYIGSLLCHRVQFR